MRKPLLLLILLILTSCKDFETKKITSEEVLDQESRSLNWKEVDEYPAFENCKSIKEIEKSKNCFETTVANSIYAYLTKKQPIVTQAIDDTLFLYLEISKSGKPIVDSVRVDTTVTNQLPELELWVRQSVDSLPKIYPAIKRGVPVSSVFKMPILIKGE